MSDKSISQKLLIKPGYKVLLINAPDGYQSSLGEIPSRAAILNQSNDPVDLIQVFISSKAELEARLGKTKLLLNPNGLLWVTYPKGTSKVKTDINRDSIAKYAQSIGLQAVAMISIDDTWSGLRLKVL